MMRRRAFILLLGGTAIIWPFFATGQQRVPRVGVLLVGATVTPDDFELSKELARIGYIAGRNINYDIRGADGDVNLLPKLARELAAAKPDVIVTSTSSAAQAMAEATHDIPIVMMVVGDPIALGLTNSISRPTRNVTGFTLSTVSLAAKRLELLRELVPALHKVAYLWVPANPLMTQFGEQVRMAAGVLGIELVSLPLTTSADIAAAFAVADTEHVAAVLVEPDMLTVRFSGTIVDECLVRDLPAMHGWPFEVRNGALISYGPAAAENYRRTAIYVDRLIKGAKIADLPFEEPTQIKLAINMRTARSIGISVPPMLLARADEVIE